jgi:hypothetical protein
MKIKNNEIVVGIGSFLTTIALLILVMSTANAVPLVILGLGCLALFLGLSK